MIYLCDCVCNVYAVYMQVVYTFLTPAKQIIVDSDKLLEYIAEILYCELDVSKVVCVVYTVQAYIAE